MLRRTLSRLAKLGDKVFFFLPVYLLGALLCLVVWLAELDGRWEDRHNKSRSKRLQREGP